MSHIMGEHEGHKERDQMTIQLVIKTYSLGFKNWYQVIAVIALLLWSNHYFSQYFKGNYVIE